MGEEVFERAIGHQHAGFGAACLGGRSAVQWRHQPSALGAVRFYKWRDRPRTHRQDRRSKLAAAVRAVFDDSGGTYGSEYTSAELAAACARWRVRPSMGRVGSCFDNAVAEATFSTIKVEYVHRRPFRTRAEAG
jgi:transposase InsO family protein